MTVTPLTFNDNGRNVTLEGSGAVISEYGRVTSDPELARGTQTQAPGHTGGSSGQLVIVSGQSHFVNIFTQYTESSTGFIFRIHYGVIHQDQREGNVITQSAMFPHRVTTETNNTHKYPAANSSSLLNYVL